MAISKEICGNCASYVGNEASGSCINKTYANDSKKLMSVSYSEACCSLMKPRENKPTKEGDILDGIVTLDKMPCLENRPAYSVIIIL
ncbi:MAG: hypothetical protein JW700_03445 [Candidatus Aenigmarchaeota archaeon]|nr:hypothetical protein [Candidatus Aenigmarchaeota archaeon]